MSRRQKQRTELRRQVLALREQHPDFQFRECPGQHWELRGPDRLFHIFPKTLEWQVEGHEHLGQLATRDGELYLASLEAALTAPVEDLGYVACPWGRDLPLSGTERGMMVLPEIDTFHQLPAPDGEYLGMDPDHEFMEAVLARYEDPDLYRLQGTPREGTPADWRVQSIPAEDLQGSAETVGSMIAPAGDYAVRVLKAEYWKLWAFHSSLYRQQMQELAAALERMGHTL